jgi:hypothetical protein
VRGGEEERDRQRDREREPAEGARALGARPGAVEEDGDAHAEGHPDDEGLHRPGEGEEERRADVEGALAKDAREGEGRKGDRDGGEGQVDRLAREEEEPRLRERHRERRGAAAGGRAPGAEPRESGNGEKPRGEPGGAGDDEARGQRDEGEEPGGDGSVEHVVADRERSVVERPRDGIGVEREAASEARRLVHELGLVAQRRGLAHGAKDEGGDPGQPEDDAEGQRKEAKPSPGSAHGRRSYRADS